MGYTKYALAGFSWQTALKLLTAVVTLVKISVLARLLTPDDFGIFSLVMIALGISEASTQTGVNLTMMQSKQSVKYFLDTAWVIAVARGFIIAILMTLMGFVMSRYYQNPQLLPLIALTSLVPAIKGFINPAIISFRKDLQFFKETAYYFALTTVEVILAILFALWLHSVLALILAIIGSALVEVVISHLFLTLKPRFNYLASRARVIFENAKWFSVSSLLDYLNTNLDDIIIGKIFGSYSLGLYHNAYSLSHKVNYEVAKSVHHGTLPIFTRLLNKPRRLARAFYKTIGGGGLLTLVGSTVLFIFPQFFVELILGSQWLEVVPLIRWLVAAGIFQSLGLLGYTLFLAKNAFFYLNGYQFINLLLTSVLIYWFGIHQGLTGAVMGLAVGRLLALPIVAYGVIHETR